VTADQTNVQFREIVRQLNQLDQTAPAVDAAPALEELPPGTAWGYTPDGQRVPVYFEPPTPAPAPAPHETRVSGRAKDAALIATTSGIGVGAAATGIGWGLNMAGTHGTGLMQAAIALAVGTGSLAFLKMLIFPGRRDQSVTNVTNHITQNVTARPFGRASSGNTTGGGVTKK
jgi:hypothetical protein